MWMLWVSCGFSLSLSLSLSLSVIFLDVDESIPVYKGMKWKEGEFFPHVCWELIKEVTYFFSVEKEMYFC